MKKFFVAMILASLVALPLAFADDAPAENKNAKITKSKESTKQKTDTKSKTASEHKGSAEKNGGKEKKTN